MADILILDRADKPLYLSDSVYGSKKELCIRGEVPQGNRTAFLSPKEMRIVAYRLLAVAEEMG